MDGSQSQVWNWILVFFMAHTVFPPLIFCAIYTLKIQTINNCSKWWKTDLCTVNIISCYDAEACPGRKINKSAGTDTKQFNMASLCDTYYSHIYNLNVIWHIWLDNIWHQAVWIWLKIRENRVLQKGHSLIQWWSGISLINKQKRTFHSPVSWNETLF